ncbi:MAG: amino acid--tRNA ligase-related protein, partial [Streptosporangiaceae bacterium]
MRVRLDKVERLRANGIDPYPVGFPRTATIGEVRAKYPDLEPDTATGDRVGITGRVMLSRVGGKLCFATLRDGTAEMQVMVSLAGVGEDSLKAWKSDVDLGDHVGIEGEVIASRRGELSIMADSWAITSKCLRPLPDKHAGLTDPEARVRYRYLDLIVNDEARTMAYTRSAAVRAVRDFWHDEGYLEVETPMLQPIHGGAAARPFKTHINAYDLELYLRIAIELYLKRLVVGGIEKVFEINRNFRNEGADSTHNPEFTMLEAYGTYLDYNDMADLTQRMYQKTVVAALGTSVVVHEGLEYDLGLPEWPRITLYGAVS